MFLTIVVYILVIAYAVLLLLYLVGWLQQQYSHVHAHYTPSAKISIIIAARNEALNIMPCIQSILSQNYPAELFEIIIVDDFSTDDTAAIVDSFRLENVRCIKLADYIQEHENIIAYKKRALATGIAQSKGELIITTDADCIAPENWLRAISYMYQQNDAVMIIAPVDYICDESVVQLFQSLDFMTMQGITAAAHNLKLGNMCNGANLAFSKLAFEKVGGYEGIEHLATGDDYLLMTKISVNFPNRIYYLKSKDAIVKTSPQPDWKSFLNQRIRWASKTGKYSDTRLTIILSLVYLFNLSLFVLAVAGFWDDSYWLLLVCFFCVKLIVEIIFLLPVASFFNKTRHLIIFPLLQPLHIAYIIIAGFLGMKGVYQWKDREVR